MKTTGTNGTRGQSDYSVQEFVDVSAIDTIYLDKAYDRGPDENEVKTVKG